MGLRTDVWATEYGVVMYGCISKSVGQVWSVAVTN